MRETARQAARDVGLSRNHLVIIGSGYVRLSDTGYCDVVGWPPPDKRVKRLPGSEGNQTSAGFVVASATLASSRIGFQPARNRPLEALTERAMLGPR